VGHGVAGVGVEGLTSARAQRAATPAATKARASAADSSPASMPTPRAASSSHSERTSRSPWFTEARSGSSVQAATSASRRAGSGSMAAEVLSEISTPGQASRTARRAAAQGAAASVWRRASS
jgi:hypothetical protein